MQVSLRGVSRQRMRDFCHMADVPGVLFSFDDDLLRQTKIQEDIRETQTLRTIV